MIVYKCPVCGSDIEQTDVVISMNNSAEDFMQGSYRMRIDTSLKHSMPIINQKCFDSWNALAKELQETLNSVTGKKYPNTSQETHGL